MPRRRRCLGGGAAGRPCLSRSAAVLCAQAAAARQALPATNDSHTFTHTNVTQMHQKLRGPGA